MDVKLFICLAGLLLGVTGDGVELDCPDGWIFSVNRCYKVVADRRVTWSEAAGECGRYDAELIKFEYQDELTWFQGYVSTQTEPSYWTDMNNLGLGDWTQKGIWFWGQNEYVMMPMIRWGKHPGNDVTSGCGGLTMYGLMSDMDCSSKQGFMCNIERVQGQNCPGNWIQTDTDCYYVSNTSDPLQLVTWTQAKAKCAGMTSSGSHLVTIDDINDKTFISQNLIYMPGTTFLYWTGLYFTHGSWKWDDGATDTSTYFNWTTEPDNLFQSEHCGVFLHQGAFSDRECNSSYAFVCQKLSTLAFQGSDASNHGCGPWTRGGGTCYKFFPDANVTWMDAKSACVNLKGDLLNIKDLDTKAWIRLQLMDPQLDRTLWSALNDRAQEGNYVWGDNTPINANVVSWNGEPNDLRGVEDCAVITNQGQYLDVPCDSYAAPICELDSSNQGCPTVGNWVSRPNDVEQGTTCYLFGSQSNQSQTFTQPEVVTYCNSFALSATLIPHLLNVDTDKERTFIKDQLSKVPYNPSGFWTGLTDRNQEGAWHFDGQGAVMDSSLM